MQHSPKHLRRTNVQLLRKLRTFIIAEDIFCGMYISIKAMGIDYQLTKQQAEQLKAYLNKHQPKVIQEGGHWFNNLQKKPRINWLSNHIIELNHEKAKDNT